MYVCLIEDRRSKTNGTVADTIRVCIVYMSIKGVSIFLNKVL